MISRYGKNKGIEKWNNYIKKQKETKSFDYMVNKFGLAKATEINHSKGLTKENFIRKYGKKKV